MARPSDATAVLRLLRERPPSLGAGRLLCLDGPSGSGKTTLATAVARLDPTARVVHLDALYDGWDGLPRLGDQLAGLLGPLAQGRPGSYRRYDWHRGAYAERVTVPPGPILVLEGVGSGSLPTGALATLLVWLDAARDVRRRRGLDRDGDSYAPHWEGWEAAERSHFAEHRTRERADLEITTG